MKIITVGINRPHLVPQPTIMYLLHCFVDNSSTPFCNTKEPENVIQSYRNS